MLTTMRRRVRSIMFVVAATFGAGFLLGEVWRLLASRGASNRSGVKPGVVGQVGSYQITAEEYRRAREAMSANYRQDSLFRDMSAEDEARIDQLTWSRLAGEYTWNQVLVDAKLRITDGEMNWLLVNNPPEWAQKHPDLQTDGVFDTTKYIQVLQNARYAQLFAGYFRDLYEQRRQAKLQLYALSAWRPVQAEVNEATLQANTVWGVTSLYFGRAAVAEQLDAQPPADDELKRYYRQHADEFRTPKEIRELRHVSFPVRLSAEDSVAARARIDAAHARLRGADTASMRDSVDMAMFTDSDYAPETASVAVTRSQLTPPADSAVRRIRPGQFTPPVPAEGGWQIIMLDSSRGETLWVRRVRTRIMLDNAEEIGLGEQVQQFIAAAETSSFDSAAIAHGLPVAPVTTVMVDGKVAQASFPLYAQGQLETWARTAKPGEVFDVALRGPGALHVFELASVVPAGLRPWGDDVRERALQFWRRDQAKQLWLKAAGEAVAEVRAGKTLEQYAQEHPAVQLISDEVNGVWDYMTRSERGIEYAGAVMALDPGQVTGPVDTRGGAYVIRCDRRTENQVLDPQQYLQQRGQQAAQQLAQELWQGREVRDYRAPRGY